MSSKTTRTDLWEENRNRIVSSKGGWRIGEAVYNHGYSMLDDLVGEVSYFQLMLLNVTGRLPEKRLADWLEASYICMSWPDSRIWCNQIGALGGSSRTSPAAAAVAGVLASDSHLYGPGILPKCMAFIRTALEDYQNGKSVEAIVSDTLTTKGVIPGFARPIARGDERVTAMQRVGRQLGFEAGAHETLALAINALLEREYDESINIGGYAVSFLADQHISTIELKRFTTFRVAAGVQACYAEAADNPAGSYLPLRCDDIHYTGVPPRELD